MNRPALHLIGSGPEKVSDLPRVTQLVSGRGLVLFPESVLPPVFTCHLLTSWTGESPALVITAGHRPRSPSFISLPCLEFRSSTGSVLHGCLFFAGDNSYTVLAFIFSFLLGSVFSFTLLLLKIILTQVICPARRSYKTQHDLKRRGYPQRGSYLEQGEVLLWKGLRLVFPSSMQVNYCLKFLGGFHWWRLCELCLLDAGSCYFLPSCPGCKTKGAVYLAHLATGTTHIFY